MRISCGIALALASCALLPDVRAEIDRDPRRAVALRDLVRATDPLRVHDLHFDARFAVVAADYLASGDPAGAGQLARLPATAHLLEHARQFDYDVPRESADALARVLLGRSSNPPLISRSIAFFLGPLLDDPHWVGDALRYLPPDFRFRGSLFLVAGYDIGVALAPNASLNAAHAHFDAHPRELLYYAIHELHHVGFMTYSPPPRIADLRTCADLLNLVEYSTALEGSAVVAALDRRTREHALADDEDYVALADEEKMSREEARFFQDYDYLKRRGAEATDREAWAVIDRMSSGERLWYRVGARIAERVERLDGRPALVALIAREPRRLVETYRRAAGHDAGRPLRYSAGS